MLWKEELGSSIYNHPTFKHHEKEMTSTSFKALLLWEAIGRDPPLH